MSSRNGTPPLVFYCPVHGLAVQVAHHGGLLTRCAGCVAEAARAFLRLKPYPKGHAW